MLHLLSNNGGNSRALAPAVVLGLVLATTGAARAAASCTHSGAIVSVVVTSPGDNVTVSRTIEGAITVDGQPCGDATVGNIDTIEVADTSGGATGLVVDLSNGALAPGFTPESSGTPEIELSFDPGAVGDTPDTLHVLGSAASDMFTLGTAGFNLNADGDADITSSGLGDLGISVAAEAGDDIVSAAGAKGTGEAATTAVDLAGGEGDDVLTGGKGSDLLTGGAGADRERGGAGSDHFAQGQALDVGDLLDGGPGSLDVADYSARTEAVFLSVDGVANDGQRSEKDDLRGVESMRGSERSDELSGTDSDDHLLGLAGADTLNGKGGSDEATGGLGADEIYGGVGNDELTGSGGADLLDGAKGDDYLEGGKGRDVLIGGAGTDTCVVRPGDDDVTLGCEKILGTMSQMRLGVRHAA